MEDNKIARAINAESRALSNTIVNNFRTGYKIQISWKINSQNVSNNTSNVTVQAQLVSTGGSYTINASATKNGSLTINGAKYSFTFNASLVGNQTKTVYTKTVDITHDNSGNKICPMSCDLGINVTLSGTYWGTVTASGSGDFNSIPRTSTFSLNVNSAELGRTKIEVRINRASTSFRHRIIYKFGNINSVKTEEATSSYSFIPSIEDCLQIPNANSGIGTIVVETYNGSTFIGSNSVNLTLVVPSDIVPSISDFVNEVVAAGAPESFGYLQGKSKVKLTIVGATGNQGSTITSYKITGANVDTSSSSFVSPTLNNAGTVTYSAYALDSRGRMSNTVTTRINVKAYSSPRIDSFLSFRCLSNGRANDDGTFLSAQTIFAYTPLPNSVIEATVKYKETTSSNWSKETPIVSNRTIVVGDGLIATDRTYDVLLTLKDSFSSTTRSVTIGTAFVTLDLKRGGKGVGIGKAAEFDYLLDIGVEVQLNNNKLKLTNLYEGNPGIGYETGTSDVFISNINNNWLRLKGNNTMTYAGHKVYTSFDKPSAGEIGALSTNGGSVYGMTYFNRGSNTQSVVVETADDYNGYGDGQTHFGYNSNGSYSHYLRGKGSFYVDMHNGITVSKGIKTGTSIVIGDFDDGWRACVLRRHMAGRNYSARYTASYLNSVKLSSSSSPTTMPACCVEIQDETSNSTIRRYMFGTLGFLPATDNNTYLGSSNYRWQAVYASTGTVYSSSVDEKENIKSINTAASSKPSKNLGNRRKTNNSEEGKCLKETIVQGIRDAKLYSYNYKNTSADNAYIGFLGQEMKKISPLFFNLLGASSSDNTTEEGQFDIRESSVIGVLWAGLQEALNKNEQLEIEIQEIRKKLNM